LDQYKGTFVLISNDRVAASAPSSFEIKEAWNKLNLPFSSFLALVGEENHKPAVILQDTSQHSRSTTLLAATSVPPPHDLELCKVQSFSAVYQLFDITERRPFVTYPIQTKKDANFVVPLTFFIDTGSVDSFLTPGVISQLGVLNPKGPGFALYINGQPNMFLESPPHPAVQYNINLLGSDVLWANIHVFEGLTEYVKSLRKKNQPQKP